MLNHCKFTTPLPSAECPLWCSIQNYISCFYPFNEYPLFFFFLLQNLLIGLYGRWQKKDIWDFDINYSRGTKCYTIEEPMQLAEFIRFVCEAYDLEKDKVDISYAIPKQIQEECYGSGAPPVFLKCDKDLANAIAISKSTNSAVVHLYVSLKTDWNGADFFSVNEERAAKRSEDSPRRPENYCCRCGDFAESVKAEGQTAHSFPDITDVKSARKEKKPIRLGAILDSKRELIFQLRMLALTQKFDFDICISRLRLFTARCYVPGCRWRIRASTYTAKSESLQFVVRILIENHTCSAVRRYIRKRQCTPKFVGRLYVEELYNGRNLKGITPTSIKDSFKGKYGFDIGYKKAQKALAYARILVRGTYEDGYKELPAYMYRLQQANPGTIAELKLDGDGRFKYLFIALHASIKGFKFLRRVVVVDGAHLSGKYRGVMLVAAGQDANNGIFPIAFGIVDSENNDSWEWFFSQLRRVIHDDRNLAIISDRNISIAAAVEKVFPASVRGICYHHLKGNILKHYRRKPMTQFVFAAAYAYREKEFQENFDFIRGHYPELAKYLEDAKFELWACSHFPGERYGVMTSNIAESINSVLLEDRTFPIRLLVECITMILSDWFVQRRDEAAALGTNLPSRIEAIMHAMNDKMTDLTETRIDDHSSLIKGGDYGECIVNLLTKSCGCKQYDVLKIPCEHAIFAARTRKIDECILPDGCFTKETYGKTYAEVIHPIDRYSTLPPEVRDKKVLPPDVRNPRGRPKIKRYRSAIEKAVQVVRSKCVKLEMKHNSPAKKRKPHQSKATKTKIPKLPPSSPKQVLRIEGEPKLQPSTPTQGSKVKRVTTPPSSTKPTKNRKIMPSTSHSKVLRTRSRDVENTPAAVKKLNLGKPTPTQASKHKRVATPPSSTKPTKNRKIMPSSSHSKVLRTRSRDVENTPAAVKKLNLGKPTPPQLTKPKRRKQQCSKCGSGGHNRSTCPK